MLAIIALAGRNKTLFLNLISFRDTRGHSPSIRQYGYITNQNMCVDSNIVRRFCLLNKAWNKVYFNGMYNSTQTAPRNS